LAQGARANGRGVAGGDLSAGGKAVFVGAAAVAAAWVREMGFCRSLYCAPGLRCGAYGEGEFAIHITRLFAAVAGWIEMIGCGW